MGKYEMKRISFNPQFVNSSGDNLINGKIHTIRQNYGYWKLFEGEELALFTWEGKSYQKGSKQKIFCVKRLVSVQPVMKSHCNVNFWTVDIQGYNPDTGYQYETIAQIRNYILARNDGLTENEFVKWFYDYPYDIMAILHFTNFKY